MATTPAKRACPECGTLLPEDGEICPVCALRHAVKTQRESIADSASCELRFEHYTVLQNAEGEPFELGRGAMGVTYKAFDVRLQRPAALKIINSKLFGNESARLRFIREAQNHRPGFSQRRRRGEHPFNCWSLCRHTGICQPRTVRRSRDRYSF